MFLCRTHFARVRIPTYVLSVTYAFSWRTRSTLPTYVSSVTCVSMTHVIARHTYSSAVRMLPTSAIPRRTYSRDQESGLHSQDQESGLCSRDQESGLRGTTQSRTEFGTTQNTPDLMKKIPLAHSGLRLAPKNL